MSFRPVLTVALVSGAALAGGLKRWISDGNAVATGDSPGALPAVFRAKAPTAATTTH